MSMQRPCGRGEKNHGCGSDWFKVRCRHTWGIFEAKEVFHWLILLRLGLGAPTMSLPSFPQPCHLSR